MTEPEPPTVRAQARIALATTGASLATPALLDLRLAHARARDAVYTQWNEAALAAQLPTPVLTVHSQASDRQTYLGRPDRARTLAPECRATLAPHAAAFDLLIAIGDGLSPQAPERHAPPLLRALLPALRTWSLAPITLVRHARVATADEIGIILGARAVLILIGERPGLSAPDSLGAYLTWGPTPTTPDSARNCISNIRPEGLSYQDAAHRLHHLLERMRALQLTGVALKDESDGPDLLPPA